jgi:hypothetical protein
MTIVRTERNPRVLYSLFMNINAVFMNISDPVKFLGYHLQSLCLTNNQIYG